MKILFTGGGTGGHFYPIIAVAQAMRQVSKEQKLLDQDLYFVAPNPYNEKILFDNQITYKNVPAGKIRRYFSLLNVTDLFKTGFGILKAMWTVFWIYPDVIFSKGGYGSFPVVLVGKLLGIPIIIHESDSTPGFVNKWAGKFADKIAISYPEAGDDFIKEKVAWTGNPVRSEISNVVRDGAAEYLDLEDGVPVIFILGGSQGSKIINDAIVDALPKLIKDYQIIHQTGRNNFEQVKNTADVVMGDDEYKHRYHAYAYLDDLGMKMSAGASDIIISRAGSTLFEISTWQRPAIIIPITKSNRNHQRVNAYTYARFGGGIVIEERNLTDDILVNEINRILTNEETKNKMIEGAKKFAKPDAAHTIAEEILETALKHQK
jgi:UDP-N-acetylglucosamine--N-acetylmuramyl-(pentapeptide) pyrophosphoryl-undecaprenol N-acetylglucosamine transferase